jgi:hypothetical protein
MQMAEHASVLRSCQSEQALAALHTKAPKDRMVINVEVAEVTFVATDGGRAAGAGLHRTYFLNTKWLRVACVAAAR